MPREVKEHFEPPIQPFTLMPSTPTEIPAVHPAKPSTPVRAETSASQPKAVTPVKATSPLKPSVIKEQSHFNQEASVLVLEELLKFQLNSRTKDLCV